MGNDHATASGPDRDGGVVTHSEEVLAQLHEQVAEMCRYLEVPDDAPPDTWALRDAIVTWKKRAKSAEAELDFEYGIGLGQPALDYFKWESF